MPPRVEVPPRHANWVLWLLAGLASCGGGAGGDPASGDAGAGDAPAPAACTEVTDAAAVVVAVAASDGEHALVLPAHALTATSWGTRDAEALVLEVATAARGLIGHLVVHQGAADFAYTMHLGALAAGEAVEVRVSTLSAPNAIRAACVGPGTLRTAAELGAAAEGMVNAPVFRWPVQKRFNDVPLVVGWSASTRSYQTVFTNEDGGTVAQCGGAAAGVQAEIARWGRASDIEGDYAYASPSPRWGRCTGTVAVTTTPVRMEGAHPNLYYGDGHNRLFESRAGYGQTCGTGGPEKANGNLTGWNVDNPSNALADDAGRVIILRPLPVDMDVLGYGAFRGRREGLADHHAPWLYRLTSLELEREGRIDGVQTFAMDRYLYADVRVADVGGSGDPYCATLGVSGGFKLRAITTTGDTIDGAQVTADVVAGHDYKRVAIPLPAGTVAGDIDHFEFDAYDGDGIYLTAIGDAFIPAPTGDNGARLDYVRHDERALTYYVDDDNSGCVNGVNPQGPGGVAYACAGSLVSVPR